MTTNTGLASKCDILTDIWTNHFDHEMFEDFIETYDLGFPMAYFIANGIVEATPLAIELVDDTFKQLLKMFEYEDEGFTSLQDFWGFM